MPHLLAWCLDPIRADGLTNPAAWQGAAALAIAVVPSLLALVGAARSGVRVVATAARRRARPAGAQLR
ncbi:hypothetical protein [Micromonospora sp. CPCC 205556]|uniref:hypothetical protein n=1 Tax=Micromonospora sp. CPCC 205556 TaxID=3122398 RepID=UPI002FF3D7FA